MKDMAVDQETMANLIAKARQGDRGAFETVVVEHQDQLRTYIRIRIGRHLRGRLEPEDVFQDTLMHAFQSVAHFTWRGDTSFQRWLEAIAEHRIRDAAKSSRTQQSFQLDRPLPAPGVSPSKDVRRNDRFDRLQGSLDRLSPAHREVIILCRLQGLKISQAAQRMQRSESALKNLLLRALKELKADFGDTESLHLPDRELKDRQGVENGE
jgi:RNA polymerase sigma-70 factor (ECF subfamily)